MLIQIVLQGRVCIFKIIIVPLCDTLPYLVENIFKKNWISYNCIILYSADFH